MLKHSVLYHCTTEFVLKWQREEIEEENPYTRGHTASACSNIWLTLSTKEWFLLKGRLVMTDGFTHSA